jgi:hypothetical protein
MHSLSQTVPKITVHSDDSHPRQLVVGSARDTVPTPSRRSLAPIGNDHHEMRLPFPATGGASTTAVGAHAKTRRLGTFVDVCEHEEADAQRPYRRSWGVPAVACTEASYCRGGATDVGVFAPERSLVSYLRCPCQPCFPLFGGPELPAKAVLHPFRPAVCLLRRDDDNKGGNGGPQ